MWLKIALKSHFSSIKKFFRSQIIMYSLQTYFSEKIKKRGENPGTLTKWRKYKLKNICVCPKLNVKLKNKVIAKCQTKITRFRLREKADTLKENDE